jgi:hypothetical protein
MQTIEFIALLSLSTRACETFHRKGGTISRRAPNRSDEDAGQRSAATYGFTPGVIVKLPSDPRVARRRTTLRYGFFSSRQPFVPPNPKEFDRA